MNQITVLLVIKIILGLVLLYFSLVFLICVPKFLGRIADALEELADNDSDRFDEEKTNKEKIVAKEIEKKAEKKEANLSSSDVELERLDISEFMD